MRRSPGAIDDRGSRGNSAVRNATGAQSRQRYDENFAGRKTQQFEGTVDRIEQADGGYQVWLDGSDHCFWVPDYRWSIWPLHIGISVVFGGFWNPLGYYNIYDYGYPYHYGYPYYGGYYSRGYYGGYYGGGYYGGGYAPYSSQPYGNGYATSYLRGYVDRFDEYNGTFVIRDDASGNYVTVYVNSDSSRFRTLQIGNWVVLSGTWTRDGYFEAYRLDEVR